MEETVNQDVEQTTADTSSVTETENTTDTSNSSSETSREDTNTPEEVTDKVDDVRQQTDYSSKSVNRFQEMANKIRDLETQNTQYSQYFQNPQAYPQSDPYAVKLAQLESQNMIIAEQQRLQSEQALFREAESKDPRMNPNSDRYDKDFDDAVTALYKSSGIEPTQGIKKISKLLEKSNYRAIESNQISQENKRASSGDKANRTASVETDGKRLVKEAYDRFAQSHTQEDHAAYTKAKRLYGNS